MVNDVLTTLNGVRSDKKGHRVETAIMWLIVVEIALSALHLMPVVPGWMAAAVSVGG